MLCRVDRSFKARKGRRFFANAPWHMPMNPSVVRVRNIQAMAWNSARSEAEADRRRRTGGGRRVGLRAVVAGRRNEAVRHDARGGNGSGDAKRRPRADGAVGVLVGTHDVRQTV